VAYLRAEFKLDWLGIHGAPHWARVRHNGMLLLRAENNPLARADVVELFALLHDHQRLNDGHDPDHGYRAALAINELRGTCFDMDDAGCALLAEALEGHSSGRTEADISVQICWDSDRLDLGRVAIYPDARHLCTASARRRCFIEAAYARSRVHSRAEDPFVIASDGSGTA
jgi:uncharacterized protein